MSEPTNAQLADTVTRAANFLEGRWAGDETVKLLRLAVQRLAQYDALMGAAKSLVHLRGHGNYRPSADQAIWVADNAIAALRAAGILEEGEK